MPDQLQNELVKRRLLDIVPQDVKDHNAYGLPAVAGMMAPEEALLYSNEFEPWSGAKNIWNGIKSLVGKEPEMKRLLPDPAPPVAPITPSAPVTPLRQPKPGGVLYDVLQRAAMKNGMGEATTPGESSLLQQFTPK